MKTYFTAFCLAVSILSCSQQTPEVHKVKHEGHQKTTQKSKTQLANQVDPICSMDVDPSIKDTAVYKGKTYGFCNPYCKQEFKKNPKKYIK